MFSFPFLKKKSIPLDIISTNKIFFNNMLAKIKLPALDIKKIIIPDNISTLPPSTKPFTVLFELEVLADRTFNWLRLQEDIVIKPYTREMLFNLGYNNEIILLSNIISDNLLNKLDPYGCIKYRFILKNPHKLNKYHLNRDLNKTIIISTREINDDFYNNTLIIEDKSNLGIKNIHNKYTNIKETIDSNINLNLTHFISTLNILNDNYQPAILSYKNKDFLPSFRITQLKYFKNKTLLDKEKYIKMLNEINEERIKEFYHAKPYMDEQLEKENMVNKLYTIKKIGYILKGIFFSFL